MTSPTKRRHSRHRLLAVSIAIAVAAAVSACGTSGRTLQDPKPGATAPPRKNSGATIPAGSASSVAGGAQLSATGFQLQTTAWKSGQAIPKPYTCDGVNTSPPLTISGVPSGTAELVLVVTNQNAPSQSLWLLAGLGPATVSIPQGGVPSGAIQIVNSSGTARWSGPCPTAGTNSYEFALYALSAPSGLTTSATFADVNAAIALANSASIVTGTYSR